MDMCDKNSLVLHDFAEIVEKLTQINITLEKADLGPQFQNCQKGETITYKMYLAGYHKKCYHHWRPEDVRRVGLQKGMFKGFNTGGLLWGETGSGKSQILSYLTAWAHENQWVNLTVANCPEFVDVSHNTERMENGLYLQHSLATRMLNDLKISNEEIFR